MKLKVALVVLAVSAFVACGPSYHHGYGEHYNQGNYGYGSSTEAARAYDYGYKEGREHGYSDRRAGEDFQYSHDRRFQEGISRDRYVNDRFREGYVRGYQDGYYGRGGYGRY